MEALYNDIVEQNNNEMNSGTPQRRNTKNRLSDLNRSSFKFSHEKEGGEKRKSIVSPFNPQRNIVNRRRKDDSSSPSRIGRGGELAL